MKVSREVSATAGGSAERSLTDAFHYRMAADRLPLGFILDDGCGSGTGTRLIAGPGRKIVALDPDAKAVFRARAERLEKWIEFLPKWSTRLPFKDSAFAAAVSFEVIEHLQNQTQYLVELARVVEPEGLLFLSTPNRRVIEPYYCGGLSPVNITHVKELYPEELKILIEHAFTTIELYAVSMVDKHRRERSLIYQRDFVVPYSLRAKIPMPIRRLWMKLRHVDIGEDWQVRKTRWEDVIPSPSLEFEDLIVIARRNGRVADSRLAGID
jgi:SAM-dependent methyltransferase